MLQICKIYH